MTTKSSAILLVIITGLLSSCGTNKKLQSAQAEISDLQSRNEQLTTQNNQLTNNISSLNKQVTDLTSQHKTLTDQFNSYKKECQENEEDLAALENLLEELLTNMQKLEEALETALADFNEKGLDVYSKDGVIYVDMQDNLLYKTGSATLSPDGKKALGDLASVLNQYPKLEVIVVGNTDTTHVKGVADNWSLSTERANNVVRILREKYTVDPGRLVAAGRGKFHPIADNSTKEGRAKNRRTEIVLNPDFVKIWERIKKGQ